MRLTKEQIEARRKWWQERLDDGLVHAREQLDFWRSEVTLCDMALSSLSSREAGLDAAPAAAGAGWGAIWLRREDRHLIVSVEASPGKWVEVIREFADAPASHIVEPSGIKAAIHAAPREGE